MIISLNWLKHFTDIHSSVDELTALIGSRLVEIEDVEYIGDKYKDVIVVKIVECAPLEGSDHLNVTKVDDGGVVEGVERDNNGNVQVVCGAPNVKVGMLAAWLPPLSVVPETFKSDEPFVLGAKPLRGVLSNGMLASPRELDLYDYHEGILSVDVEVEPGTRFADVYELDDYLLNIENKSLTHRPDAFGLIGFAREVAGIQGLPFTTPEWFTANALVSAGSAANLTETPTVTIEDPELSARFEAVVLEGMQNDAKSPVHMQTLLARSGIRPISVAVDIANYVMLVTGQPSHTYDYDKLIKLSGSSVSGSGPVSGSVSMCVRLARKDETLKLLDGKVISLDPTDIVITAGDIPVSLAGAMGGLDTAVDSSTTRVLLEVATFDLYHIRTTQMRHGMFSEAVTRMTKGVPAPIGAPALAEVVRLFEKHTGARAASEVIDAYPRPAEPIVLTVTEDVVNDTLGTRLVAEDIVTLLENVGFSVSWKDRAATVTVPDWREDIHIVEDVIEEIGRLSGYDSIALTVPRRDMTAVTPNEFDVFRATLRSILVRAGLNEVLTYSFVHGNVLERAGQSAVDSYRITNSLSPDLQYYRQSLTPSLLGLIHPNGKSGYDAFGIFEMNKTHDKSSGLTVENVPLEHDRLALVWTNSRSADASGAAYYQAKYILDYIAGKFGIVLEFKTIEGKETDPALAPFEPKRSAVVFNQLTGAYLGVVGEYRKQVRKSNKLPDQIAGFEVNTAALFEASLSQPKSYAPVGRYPSTERDICFQVPHGMHYQYIVDETERALGKTDLVTSIEPVDIYRPEGSETKNVTIRVKFMSYERTLTSDEINVVMQSITEHVVTTTGGNVI